MVVAKRQCKAMKGPFKIIALTVTAVICFAGYTALFATLSGINLARALSSLELSAPPTLLRIEGGKSKDRSKDSSALTGSPGTQDSIPVAVRADSLGQQLAVINTEKAELEKLRIEITALLKARIRTDSIQVHNLAKIYEAVDVAQLVAVMANMDDSLVIAILPRMKSQKAGKLLESMPAERAARISSKLLRLN